MMDLMSGRDDLGHFIKLYLVVWTVGAFCSGAATACLILALF